MKLLLSVFLQILILDTYYENSLKKEKPDGDFILLEV